MILVKLKAGKIPGPTPVKLVYDLEGKTVTVLQVLTDAANQASKKFTFNTGEYIGENGKTMIDIPFVNGVACAKRIPDRLDPNNDRWTDVKWDTPVTEKTFTVLLMPKVQGNQHLACVAKHGQQEVEVALATGMTVSDALKLAGYTLYPGESILVNELPATLSSVLKENDYVFITKSDVVVTDADIANVAEIDPGKLQKSAQEKFELAEKKKEQAKQLLKEADGLTVSANAEATKAARIVENEQKLKDATDALYELGVFKDEEEKPLEHFTAMKPKDLKTLFEDQFGVKPGKDMQLDFLVQLLFQNQ